MAVFRDITTLIDQLNVGDRCWNFSSMEIGTCFTMSIYDLHANRILINVRGETIEKTFSVPTQLKKLITTEIFKKTIAEGLDPVIEYLEKTKHLKINDREYHNFKVMKNLTKDGKEVINSSTTTTY